MKCDFDILVNVSIEDNRLVITPVKTLSTDLEKLLEGITKSNLHIEADFGEPAGQEFPL